MSQIQRYDVTTALQDIETVTGDTGGAVGPDGAGNINLIGETDIVSVSGNQGTNTLTILMVDKRLDTATTVGAVTADLMTITLIPSICYTINSLVIGTKNDFTEGFGGMITCVVRRAAAGGALLVYIDARTDGEGVDADATFVVSGNDIILQVTGEVGDTYFWLANTTFDFIT